MIKPIIYHSFEEKEKIEQELLAQIPIEKRKAVAKKLMSIFYIAQERNRLPIHPSHARKTKCLSMRKLFLGKRLKNGEIWRTKLRMPHVKGV